MLSLIESDMMVENIISFRPFRVLPGFLLCFPTLPLNKSEPAGILHAEGSLTLTFIVSDES